MTNEQKQLEKQLLKEVGKQIEKEEREKKIISELTLRQKLARIRAEFSEASIKKSGVNNYSGFSYFELSDIVPVALKLFLKYEVTLDFNMGKEIVEGALYDNTKDVEPIKYAFPKRTVEGLAKMNSIQIVGSEITYYRRYLYAILLDIAENDSIDDKKQESTKPKVSRDEAKKELTNPNAPADALQIEALKNALKKLREKDSSYETEIQDIAAKTKAFTKLTKQECEELILNIGGLLNDNSNVEG